MPMSGFAQAARMVRFAALSAFVACTSATAPQQTDLAVARQRWALSNVRSYNYTVYRFCECPPEWSQGITVSVSNGIVTSRINATTGQPAASSDVFSTIDALFDTVDAAIAGHADYVNASYDSVTGVPLRISIDRSFQVIDDEYWLTVANFRAGLTGP